MAEELKEIGLDIGQRRVGRLMCQNGILVIRTRNRMKRDLAIRALKAAIAFRAPTLR